MLQCVHNLRGLCTLVPSYVDLFEMLPELSLAAVIEGMDLVMKIESYGSGSGATSKKVVIADSGEIPATSAEF